MLLVARRSPVDPEEKVRIAKRLRRFRQESELTQEEAAFAAKVPLITLQRWEQGKSLPRLSSLALLGLVYGRDRVDFISEEEPGPPDFRDITAFVLFIHPKADRKLASEATIAITELNDRHMRQALRRRPEPEAPPPPERKHRPSKLPQA